MLYIYFLDFGIFSFRISFVHFNIATYSGLAWRIIMGSGIDDWIYWHFFTITVNRHSSHIELLLNDVYLTNLYEESLTALNDACLTNESLKSLHSSVYRLARIQGNPCKWFVVTKSCLPKLWLLCNRSSSVACLTSGIYLPKRCLAEVIFRHNVILPATPRSWSFLTIMLHLISKCILNILSISSTLI
jgi:hypothetical protein